MKLEVTCLEADAHITGQMVHLAMDVPPPLPATDGYGNPVAHPPPPAAQLRLFVTSDERRDALSKADPLRRRIKSIRPELAADPATAATMTAERAKLEKELALVLRKADSGKEIQFEHGARYIVTIERAK